MAAAALLLMYILQYGFILWVIVAPLAIVNSNNFWSSNIAEFILKECHSLLSYSAWIHLCLSVRRQDVATWESLSKYDSAVKPSSSGAAAQLRVAHSLYLV